MQNNKYGIEDKSSTEKKVEEVELTAVQKKINKAKKKIATVKAIEKLEKEVLRLEKNIATKKAKIEALAEEL